MIRSGLRFNAYEIISRAVEEGIQFGLNRAYKYEERPSRENLAEHIEREVMNALSAVLVFEGDEILSSQ